MEEPPLKRAKRATDDDLSRNSSKNGRDHAKSKSRLDDGGDRDEGGGRQRPKIQQKDGRRNDRSRSRDDTYNDNKRHRERSRSRERSHRDRVERGGGAAARERHVNGGDSLERHNKSSQGRFLGSLPQNDLFYSCDNRFKKLSTSAKTFQV